jgi:hypothetical protein
MLSLPKRRYCTTRAMTPTMRQRCFGKLSMTVNVTPNYRIGSYNRPKFSPRINTMPITMSIK